MPRRSTTADRFDPVPTADTSRFARVARLLRVTHPTYIAHPVS
ncbi:hypothetical protein BJ973_000891 [Actinoplanes tereljensis]|nr:hypothetical protein [Actinoplanes tereljensis]